LYVRRKNPRVQITAQMDGGGHERGMRSGTLNVPGSSDWARPAPSPEEMPQETQAPAILRDKLRDKLEAGLDETYINGSMEHRLPHNLNMSFAYVEGESLLMGINDVAVSSGSACTSATLEPSYVLKALGLGDDMAHSSIRFGIGRFNTEEESITWRTSDRRGAQAARTFAALRNGERRHRPEQDVKWAGLAH
jgi:cysteine desulfurase